MKIGVLKKFLKTHKNNEEIVLMDDAGIVRPIESITYVLKDNESQPYLVLQFRKPKNPDSQS